MTRLGIIVPPVQIGGAVENYTRNLYLKMCRAFLHKVFLVQVFSTEMNGTLFRARNLYARDRSCEF